MAYYTQSQIFRFIVAISAATAIIFGISSVKAAQSTNFNAVPTNVTVGTTADYSISYISSNTTNLDPNSEIDITFPSGFNITGASLSNTSSNLDNPSVNIVGQTARLVLGASASVIPSSIVSFDLNNIINANISGPYNLSLTSRDSLGVIQDDVSPSSAFTLSPDAAATISLSPSGDRTITAGTVNYVVTADLADQYGNPVANGTVVNWSLSNSTDFGLIDTITTTTGGLTYGTITLPTISGLSTSLSITSGLASATQNINIVAGEVSSIQLNRTGDQQISAGQTLQFSATAYDAYNNQVTGATFIWSGTDASGLFNQTIVGSYSVYAVSNGVQSASTIVVVNPGAPAFFSIAPQGSTNLIAGATLQFTSSLTDAFGNSVLGQSITWTNTNTDGLFISTTAGVHHISAISAGITSNIVDVTIVPGTINSINITPSTNQQISAGQTLQFSATAYDAYNNQVTGATFTWSGTDASGLFNQTAATIYQVYVAIGAIQSQVVSVTVVPNVLDSIQVSPNQDQTLYVGQTLQFTAIGYDQYGNAISGYVPTWYGADVLGRFTAVWIGQSQVFGLTGNIVSNKVVLTILPTPVASISIQRQFLGDILAGNSEVIQVFVKDSNGNIIYSHLPVQWVGADGGIFCKNFVGQYSIQAYVSDGVNQYYSNQIIINVVPNVPNEVTTLGIPDGMKIGDVFIPYVNIKDIYGNNVYQVEIEWIVQTSDKIMKDGGMIRATNMGDASLVLRITDDRMVLPIELTRNIVITPSNVVELPPTTAVFSKETTLTFISTGVNKVVPSTKLTGTNNTGGTTDSSVVTKTDESTTAGDNDTITTISEPSPSVTPALSTSPDLEETNQETPWWRYFGIAILIILGASILTYVFIGGRKL